MKRGTQKLLLVFLSFLALGTVSLAQSKPVTFSISTEGKGKDQVIAIKALIATGNKLYSIQKFGEDAPVSSLISFDTSVQKLLKDSITETGNAQKEADPSFNNSVLTYYTDSVIWRQALDLSAITDSVRLKGTISGFIKTGDEYNAFEEPFR